MNINFSTSEFYYLGVKTFIPLMGLLLILYGVTSYYLEYGLEIPTVPFLLADEDNFVLISAFGLTISLLCLSVRSRIAYIKFRIDESIIHTASGKIEIKTNRIKSINQIPFVYPPLYVLIHPDAEKNYLFFIHKEYLRFGSFVKDISEDRKRIAEINQRSRKHNDVEKNHLFK